MEKYGFKNVTIEYITINLTPDNPIYSKEMAHLIINANRQTELDGADYLLPIASNVVSKDEVEELKRIINEKYDKRLELYDAGIKQWDSNMSLTMILRGIKWVRLCAKARINKDFISNFKNDNYGNPIWLDTYEYGILRSEWNKDRNKEKEEWDEKNQLEINEPCIMDRDNLILCFAI